MRLLRRLTFLKEERKERVPGPLVERISEIYAPDRKGFPEELFGKHFDWERFRVLFHGRGPVAFWDLETCGLGNSPVFLAGILQYRDGCRPGSAGEHSAPGSALNGFLFESFLARDPAGEPRLLDKVAHALSGAPNWVTFNGRCFDQPRLRKRAFHHGIRLPECSHHRDLLLDVRKRWRGSLPNCRLGTVEKRLLGMERDPFEVPGREVPDRYFDYVESGDRRWIEPVIDHNRRDVLAMAALLLHLESDMRTEGA